MATTEDRDSLDATQAWREELYDRTPERRGELFSTISGVENDPLVTPDTVAVGVGVYTTSWAFTPATRLTLSDRGSKPGALVLIVALPTGTF